MIATAPETTPESWQQLEDLYHAALAARGEARGALLAHADPELRASVEALLANSDAEDGKLDRPAWEWSEDASIYAASGATIAGQIPSEAEMLPGRSIGPYRIEAKVGSGSMGVVYRAIDTRLQRLVAVKICQSEFTNLFEREARVIAALNHPNICQIYDVGPTYIVMEWVDGAPIVALGQRPMPLEDTLRLAQEIVSAMMAAHAKGIVHRDLKPANILLSKLGVSKLLDFGIARQLQRESDSGLATLTAQSTLIGTPAYMAPEQAECKDADERSDIFSFGAVLYEMLCCRRAFPGSSSASILGAILHRAADPLDAPPALQAIVSRCLEKDPERRYQTAGELLRSLQQASISEDTAERQQAIDLRPTWRRLVGRLSPSIAAAVALLLAIALGLGYRYRLHARGSQDSNSIAVLPLDMQSNEPDVEYISDGIAGSINNSLAKLSVFRVIPNSVTQNYKGKAAEFQQIGKALGVTTVLSGRVVQHGDDLFISIELNDVNSGKQIWGKQYSRKISGLLQLQNDIAREVSQKLRAQLSDSDRQKMTLGSTTNPEAYRLYLKGIYYTAKFSKDGFDQGVNYLNQAIALDPSYGQAYSQLAYNYINQDDWYIDPRVAGPRARQAAIKALALDETDVEAHVALAIEEQWYEWNYAAAERDFKRAIALDPEDGDARGYYSWFLPPMLRGQEALEQARLQLKSYPTSTGSNGNLGSVMVFTHQWDEAIEQLKYAIHLDPNYWFDYCFLGRALEQQKRYVEAIDTFKRGLKFDGNVELWSGLGHAYAASGNKLEAQKVLKHMRELSTQRYIGPYNFAVIYAGLGDKDQAFKSLDRAYDARSYLLVEYLNTDSRLDSLHDDPRFNTLRSRVNLPAPQTKATR